MGRRPTSPGVPATTPAPVTRRERAIRQTVAAAVGAKVFSVACSLVQVPIALHYLQTEAYGFWATLFSIVVILNFVDFGLGVGMQHEMAKAYGQDDLESMRRIFWTGTAVLGLLGAAVLVILLPTAYLLPWSAILHVKDPALQTQTSAALAVSLAAFVVALPFNAVARLAAAAQRGWIQGYWIAAGSALSLGLVAAASHFHWGFLGFLLASLMVPFFQGAGLLAHLLRELGWSARPTPPAPAAQVRRMLQSSALFAAPQFALALVQSAPALAISVAAGSSAVTAYTLLMRLFSPLLQGQLILLTPVWPAYTEARMRGDHAWVERTFRRSVAFLVVLCVGVALAAWQSPLLFRLWIGPGAVSAGTLLVSLAAAWCILQMAAQPFIYYLIGVGRLQRLARCATPGLLLSALGLFWGFGRGTDTGVLAAGVAGLALLLMPPLVWASVRSLRDDAREGRSP